MGKSTLRFQSIALAVVVFALGPIAAHSEVTGACTPPAAFITAGGPLTFCPGGSVTLTAHGGGTYLWSTGATTQSIAVTQSGSYSVTATDDGGCTFTSQPVVVTGKSATTPPMITADGPTTFCEGASVNLTSSPVSNYLWSTGAQTQSIHVTTPGSYTVSTTPTGLELIRSIPIPGSPAPENQAVPTSVQTDAAAHRAYVVFGYNNPPANPGVVQVLDTMTDATIATIPLSAQGGRAALDPILQKLYVAGQAAGVTVIDTRTNAVVNHISLPTTDPAFPPPAYASGVGVDTSNHHVFVTRDLTNELWVIDGTSDTVLQKISLTGSNAAGEVAVNSRTHRVYVTNNRGDFPLYVVDGVSNTLLQKVDTTVAAMAVDERFDRLFAGSVGSADVRVFDGSGNLLATVPQFVGGTEFVNGIAFDATRNVLYRTQTLHGGVEAIDGGSYALIKTVPTGAKYLYSAGFDSATSKLYALERDSFTGSRVDGRIHVLQADFGCAVTSSAVPVTVNSNPASSITGAPVWVTTGSSGNTASGPSGVASYAWSITNGTITAGQSSQQVTYTAGAVGTLTLALTTTNASGCSSTTSQNIRVDAQPTISIDNVSGNNPPRGTTTTFSFHVRLSTVSSQVVTVQYSTQNQTAVAGSDYVGTSGTLTFPAGTTEQTISVTILSSNGKTNEQFAVNLVNPANATIAKVNGWPSRGLGLIIH